MPPPARNTRAAGRTRNLRIWLPLGFLILLAAACFLWPLVYPVPKPIGGSILDSGLPPLSPGHIFGTDPVGNDIFSRILYGGQVSFEVGFSVTAIGLVVGGSLGMAAGYWGGARRRGHLPRARRADRVSRARARAGHCRGPGAQ